MYYLQSRYYDSALGRFINADSYASTGQGIVGFNMLAYCGNNPVYRFDATGNAYENVPEEYRTVGAGVQVEVDIGNYTVGFEIIVYWDVEECGDDGPIVAIYSYSGGAVNFCDDYLGSITATIRNNMDLLTSGTTDGISALVNIIQRNYSASVSGLLLLGNDQFTSVKSYEGPFMSLYGSLNHVKGAVAVSNSCVALGVGVTSAVNPSWGLSVTNYRLRGTMRLSMNNRLCATS